MGFLILICYVLLMDNIIKIPVDPYFHLKHFFGEKFLIVAIKSDGTASCIIGEETSVEDMAFLSKLTQLISDEFLKDNMGV